MLEQTIFKFDRVLYILQVYKMPPDVAQHLAIWY